MNHWVSDMLGIFVFLFKCEDFRVRIIKDAIQPCTVHITFSKHNQIPQKPFYPIPFFFFFFFLFFVLLAGEFSEATESFRQEVGVHFYASRSTSEVSFYMSHTCIEASWLRLLTPSLRHNYYNFPGTECSHTLAIFLWHHTDVTLLHSGV